MRFYAIFNDVWPVFVVGDDGDGSIVIEFVLDGKLLFGELCEAVLEEVVADLGDDKSDCVIKFLNLAEVCKLPGFKKVVP